MCHEDSKPKNIKTKIWTKTKWKPDLLAVAAHKVIRVELLSLCCIWSKCCQDGTINFLVAIGTHWDLAHGWCWLKDTKPFFMLSRKLKTSMLRVRRGVAERARLFRLLLNSNGNCQFNFVASHLGFIQFNAIVLLDLLHGEVIGRLWIGTFLLLFAIFPPNPKKGF